MKKNIHPNYQTVKARCACGAEFETKSTLKEEISVEVCSKCHPHYTGQQRFVDSGGRVDRFRRIMNKATPSS